jgi:hypothetical protein
MADQLKQALLKAGFNESKNKKNKAPRYFGQCKCGALLNKHYRCIHCDGITKMILRKRGE